MTTIVLASKSPRRRELFSHITENFICVTSDVAEDVDPSLSAQQACLALAVRKCGKVFEKYGNCPVVGCDTVVEYKGDILEKPVDTDDARRMLKLLSGSTHSVYTGVCVRVGQQRREFTCRTDVTFFNISDEDLESYIRSPEPYDKAGAYGIQGQAAKFVSAIDGDFFNVMGLPVSRLYNVLRELNCL